MEIMKMKKIIDVSEHQKRIDWEKVKASGVDGVILRVGFGDNISTQDDKWILYNITECERLGIPYEVYLYSYADSDAHIKSEISHIRKLLAGRNVRVWLDLEYRPAKAYWRKAVIAFLEAFPSGGVYSWEWAFTDVLKGVECPRWICAYGDNIGKPQYGFKPKTDCHGWQYTSKAKIPGINGDVDVSEWYKDFAGPTKPTPCRNSVALQMRAWEGYNEVNGRFGQIIDLYNRYLPTAVKSGTVNYSVKYSDEWCATAASAAYIACGLGSIFPVECSCPRMVTMAKKMGIWQENDNYTPSVADAVLYDWEDSGKGDDTGTPDHIGIVVAVNGDTFTVMEGNKNEAVARRTMTVGGKYIRGFVTPKFAADTKTAPVPTPPASIATPAPAAKKEETKTVAKNVYEVSKTGTPNKTTCIKWGLLKAGQRVTARVQPQNGAKPCSFSLVQPLTKIEVYDYITTAKRWAYCKVGNKYGFILASSIIDYLRIPKQSMDTVVKWVIAGDFGNGPTRVSALKTLGYDAAAVQAEVDKRFKPQPKTGWAKVLSALDSIMAAKDPHAEVIKIHKKWNHTVKESDAWCSETVVAAFLEAGLTAIIGGYAADAPTLKRHAKTLGIWHSGDSGIKAGDIVLYGGDAPNHTEIAIDATYNISGNYHGTVAKRKRAGRTIHGYIRPAYPDAKESG